MKRKHLDVDFGCYEDLVATCAPSPGLIDSLGVLARDLHLRRVLVFGARDGSARHFKGILGEAFAGYVNTATLDEALLVNVDAILIGTSPQHYEAILSILEQVFCDVLVVTVFNMPATVYSSRAFPCHYTELVVRFDGEIYPCCYLWRRTQKSLGNIAQPDQLQHFLDYDLGGCACHKQFRPATGDDVFRVKSVIIELSLTCNYSCAMCCALSPEYTLEHGLRGYPYFGDLLRFLETIRPRSIIVQGGEVLLQSSLLDNIRMIHESLPGMHIRLLTNGGVSEVMADFVNSLFDSVLVDFYGFSEDNNVMLTGNSGVKAIDFANRLYEVAPEKMEVKYLVMPNNMHDASRFVDYFIDLGVKKIIVDSAWFFSYIKFSNNKVDSCFDVYRQDLHDHYWSKTFKRFSDGIKKVVLSKSDVLLRKGMHVYCTGDIFELYPVISGRESSE